MAGPDFLSAHRRQRRRCSQRPPVRSTGGVGAIRWVTPIMAPGFAATLAALQYAPTDAGFPGADAVPIRVVSSASADYAAPAATGGDALSARFGLCRSGGGRDCVVDGDTFWFAGEKYRIADIDTPETHPARCPAEAAWGAAATNRLQQWLNAGGFTLQTIDRDTDRYDRKLRIVTRGGTSVGDALIDEGLARRWGGARQPWC